MTNKKSVYKKFEKDWQKFWNVHVTDPELRCNLRPSYYDIMGAFKHVDKYMNFKFGESVLDVGCGTGFMVELIATKATTVYGVDYSDGAVAIAKEYVTESGITIEKQDARKLSYVDGVFDKVICGGVFQYFDKLEDAGSALNEICRVCKDGGRVMLYDMPDADIMQTADGLTAYGAEDLCVGFDYKIVESFFEPERRFDIVIKK